MTRPQVAFSRDFGEPKALQNASACREQTAEVQPA